MKSTEFITESLTRYDAQEKARTAAIGQQHGMYVGVSKDTNEYTVIDGWSFNKQSDHYREKYEILSHYNYNGAAQKV